MKGECWVPSQSDIYVPHEVPIRSPQVGIRLAVLWLVPCVSMSVLTPVVKSFQTLLLDIITSSVDRGPLCECITSARENIFCFFETPNIFYLFYKNPSVEHILSFTDPVKMSSISGYTLIGDLPGTNTFSWNANKQESPSPKCIGYSDASQNSPQDISLIQSNTKTNLDVRNTTLGYGFHFQHRNSGTFPIESFAHDSGCTLVCTEYSYLKGSPNTNS
jgi:hypothetical protein